MTEIEIYGKGRKVLIPSSWDEMTPEQVRFVFRTYQECRDKGRSPLEFNVRVMLRLLGLRRSWLQQFRWAFRPSALKRASENIYRLCEGCLGFLFEEKEGKALQLSFGCVANPLPEIRRGIFGTRLIGPADLLQNLTFGEFRHAASALNSFFRSGDMNDLDECIAFLYRRRTHKPNRAGRRVRNVDNAGFGRDVRRVSKIGEWQKGLIMLWFAACLKHLQGGSVVIDGEEIDMACMFAPDGGNSSGYSFTWNDLLVQIARDRSVGNIERVDDEPLFSIFSIMWTNYKENKRNEKNSKTSKG